MAGVEQGNVSNEEFMEEVARYECVYHRNSKDFKDKNKKANCWEKIGEKFSLSTAEAEVKFRNIRTAYGRYLKRLKTIPSGSGRDADAEEVLSVGNTKFSDQCVEGPKFLSLQEYFANPKPMFSTVLELTMTSLKD